MTKCNMLYMQATLLEVSLHVVLIIGYIQKQDKLTRVTTGAGSSSHGIIIIMHTEIIAEEGMSVQYNVVSITIIHVLNKHAV